MALGSRDYELKATFTAENNAGDEIEKLEEQLAKLQRRMKSLEKMEADPSVKIKGTEKALAETTAINDALEDVDGKEAKAKVSFDKRSLSTFNSNLTKLEKRVNSWVDRPNEAELGLKTEQLERRLRVITSKLRTETNKAYEYEVRAELTGDKDVMARATRIREHAEKELETKMEMLVALVGDKKAGVAAEKMRQKQEKESQRVMDTWNRAFRRIELDGMALTQRPFEVEINGDPRGALTAIRESETAARRASARAYELSIKAREEGMTDVADKAEALSKRLDIMEANRRDIRVEMEGLPQIVAGAVTIKRVMDNATGTYTVRVNYQSLNTFAGYARLASGTFAEFVGHLRTAMPLTQSFAQKMYILQQATFAFGQAITVVAIMALGPLVSGLTILAGSLLTAAGGFGLIIAAAQPIISMFSNMSENAQKVKTATNDLESAQSAQANAARSLADAQRGVADAYRSGQQQIQSAIDAHQDALEAVEDAEQAHADAQREAADATEEVADATREYNDALATEQYRLRSMRMDIEGMRLSQQELALQINEARREMEKAESPSERREAELRYQQLLLQRKQNTMDIAQAERELTQAQKNGTDELQSAQEAREAAIESQKDANRNVKESLEAIADAQEEALKREDAITQAREDAARQMADARRQVTEAEKRLAEATEDVSAKQIALNALLGGMPAHLKAVNDAVNNFKDTYSDSFKAAQVTTARLVTRLINIARTFLPALGVVAQNTVTRVNNALSRIGNNFKDNGVLESFARILRNMPKITQNWTLALGRFGGAFINIMGIAMPYARRLSRYVADIAERFLKWTDSAEGRREINRFFKAAAPVAKELFRQIARIGGGILKWSVKHPDKVAAAIRFLGNVIVRTAVFVIGMIRAFNRFRQTHPILWRIIRDIALVYLGLRLLRGPIFFFVRLVKLLGKIVQITFAIMGLSIRSIIWSIAATASRVFKWILRPATSMVRGLQQIFRTVPRAWWFNLRNLVGIAFGVVRGVLMTFARLFLIGNIIIYVVNMIAWTFGTVINHTFPTVVGLIQMFQSGGITIWQLMWNIFKQIGADIERILIGALISTIQQMVKLLASFLNLVGNILPGLGNDIGDKLLGSEGGWSDRLFQGARDALDKQYNYSRGKTNEMAEVMGKNTLKGAKEVGKNMDMGKDKALGATEKTAKGTQIDYNRMQRIMAGKSKEGSKATQGNFKEMMRGGLGSSKGLQKGSGQSFKEMMQDMKGKSGEMKGNTLGDFGSMKFGGIKESDLLRSGAIGKAGAMQMGVNKSTTTTKEKSIQAMTEMQESGNAQMGIIQEEWVQKAWNTSIQTQESFNAILKGMAAFIENSGVSGIKKPQTFGIHGRTGGSINSTNNGGHGPRPTESNLARGGEIRYAAGGKQGPTGGVANGTTRVYGEIPGTTEFYITDNPRYRDRNLNLLQRANEHLLKNARGNEIRYQAGGTTMQGWHNVGTGNSMGVSTQEPALQGPLSSAVQMWNAVGGVKINTGGGDVNVVYGAAGGNAGLTYDSGLTEINPNSAYNVDTIMKHELGHSMGHTHYGSSIMAVPVSNPTVGAEVQAEHQRMWGSGAAAGAQGAKPVSSGPTQGGTRAPTDSGGTSGGSVNRNEVNMTGGGGTVKTTSTQGSGEGDSVGGSKVSHKVNPIFRNMPKWILRMMRGKGMGRSSALEERMAKGVIWNSGGGAGQYGPTNNSLWDAATAERAKKIIAKFPVAVNTYENHPPGWPQYAQSSIDAWDISGRGTPIGYPDPHDSVLSFMQNELSSGLLWTLGEGDVGHSGAERHVHGTWQPQGEKGSGGMSGNTGMGGGPNYAALYDTHVPKMAKGLDYGPIGKASQKRGDYIRGKHKDQMMKKTGNGGDTPPWNGGGNLDEWLRQGLIYSNAGFEASQGNISALRSRAMQESGGDPNAVNDWDINAQNGTPSKGLLQVIEPTWNAWMNEYGKSTGAFDQNWNNPIMNTATAVRYMKGEYGRIVGASGTGYAAGGIARKPHLGLVGERIGRRGGGELMWPLGSKKATRAIGNAFRESQSPSSRAADSGASRAAGDAESNKAPTSTSAGGQDYTPVVDKLDELKEQIANPQKLDPDDISNIASLVLSAIYAGLESPQGIEKVDKGLGEKWNKEMMTRGKK